MVYLYCITDVRARDFHEEKTDLLDYGDLTVAAARPKGFEPSSARNILEHYRVNDLILRNGFTVLPFAYGTVIPVTALDLFIRENYEDIRLNLGKFRGKVEMGVKILVFTGMEQTGDILKRLGDTPGHKYLSRRVEKYTPLLAGAGAINSIRNDTCRYLGRLCEDFKMKIYSQKNVLINMAFLIEAVSLNKFIQSYNTLKNMYHECKFLLSGPWPAYNFINFTRNMPVSKEGEHPWIP